MHLQQAHVTHDASGVWGRDVVTARTLVGRKALGSNPRHLIL
jgi:hypothetical protein